MPRRKTPKAAGTKGFFAEEPDFRIPLDPADLPDLPRKTPSAVHVASTVLGVKHAKNAEALLKKCEEKFIKPLAEELAKRRKDYASAREVWENFLNEARYVVQAYNNAHLKTRARIAQKQAIKALAEGKKGLADDILAKSKREFADLGRNVRWRTQKIVAVTDESKIPNEIEGIKLRSVDLKAVKEALSRNIAVPGVEMQEVVTAALYGDGDEK